MNKNLTLGIDVGGTNTDCVLIDSVTDPDNPKVLSSCKSPTTVDIYSGIKNAITKTLEIISDKDPKFSTDKIKMMSIGTTTFINAIVTRQRLAKVAVLRLCGPATISLLPMTDWPRDLYKKVYGCHYFLSGGFEYDGQEISKFSESEIEKAALEIKERGLTSVAISCVFSPTNPTQEIRAKKIVEKIIPDAIVTMSHQIGLLGFLERENSAIMNASLRPLASKVIEQFSNSAKGFNLKCPIFLTQNDGTLISCKEALKTPVKTFTCGPTNSIRGAQALIGLDQTLEENSEIMIVDIGGSTTDVGLLRKGMVREQALGATISGVKTNFKIPDILSLGLGGGSIITVDENEEIQIGPISVGYELINRAKIFGGDQLTTSDVAVALGLADFGDKEKVSDLSEEFLEKVYQKMKAMIEDTIDRVKLSEKDIPVILCGGGSILVKEGETLRGASKVIRPKNFGVANAVGSAIAQISHDIDCMVKYDPENDEEKWKQKSKDYVVKAGGDPKSIEIVEFETVPVSYLPGSLTRLKIKAMGKLLPTYKFENFENLTKTNVKYDLEKDQSEKGVEDKEVKKWENAKIENKIELGITIDKDGFWVLSEQDVDHIAIGAAVLGAGGGGAPFVNCLRVKSMIRQGKRVRVMDPLAMKDTETALALGGLGAPSVVDEKILSGIENTNVVKTMQKYSKTGKIEYVMPIECGGLNSLEPMIAAANLDIPIIDADFMQRAFPKVQMCSPFFFEDGLKSYPSCMADEKGNVVVYERVMTATLLENLMRDTVMRMFCLAGVGLPPITGKLLKKYAIHNTLTLAKSIGLAIEVAKEKKEDPIQAILDLMIGGEKIFIGKITSVKREIKGGFNIGNVKIVGLDHFKDKICEIEFQNENLIAKIDGKVKITVPDIIELVDTDSAEPIGTELMKYGQRVTVIALPTAPILQTNEAMEFISPKCFGYENLDFVPISKPFTPKGFKEYFKKN
ncbi:hydantoinase [Anaeramoeba flamelloides]|uniref:Hydantoinase n=1 Tax=Anaeramoeba flamelloides TaxID=1746091 RepID=A0ABQ8XKR3_9EUKA|nr:hydantoinase [Anaeramoeba flamelloides]